jgi:hypothetical protein
MKRKTFSRFLLSGLVFCCAAPSQAQLLSTTPVPPSKQQQTASAPVDETLGMKETIFDFGKIPQGKPVTNEFKFTNSGKVPLVLSQVSASCGCTTPEYSKEPIAPGKTGTIKATFNAATVGVFNKTITVAANVEGGSTYLVLKGEVLAPEPAK